MMASDAVSKSFTQTACIFPKPNSPSHRMGMIAVSRIWLLDTIATKKIRLKRCPAFSYVVTQAN